MPELAEFGIGVHHAGMTMDDRRTTEELFLQKVLRVITATSVGSYDFSAVHWLTDFAPRPLLSA